MKIAVACLFLFTLFGCGGPPKPDRDVIREREKVLSEVFFNEASDKYSVGNCTLANAPEGRFSSPYRMPVADISKSNIKYESRGPKDHVVFAAAGHHRTSVEVFKVKSGKGSAAVRWMNELIDECRKEVVYDRSQKDGLASTRIKSGSYIADLGSGESKNRHNNVDALFLYVPEEFSEQDAYMVLVTVDGNKKRKEAGPPKYSSDGNMVTLRFVGVTSDFVASGDGVIECVKGCGGPRRFLFDMAGVSPGFE